MGLAVMVALVMMVVLLPSECLQDLASCHIHVHLLQDPLPQSLDPQLLLLLMLLSCKAVQLTQAQLAAGHGSLRL